MSFSLAILVWLFTAGAVAHLLRLRYRLGTTPICPKCKYSLAGLEADRPCPECGLDSIAVVRRSKRRALAYVSGALLLSGVAGGSAVLWAQPIDRTTIIAHSPDWMLFRMGPWVQEDDRPLWVEEIERRIKDGAASSDVQVAVQFAGRTLQTSSYVRKAKPMFDLTRNVGATFGYDADLMNDVIDALGGATKNGKPSIRLHAILRLEKYGDNERAAIVLIDCYSSEENVAVQQLLIGSLSGFAKLQSGRTRLEIRDTLILGLKRLDPELVESTIGYLERNWGTDPEVLSLMLQLEFHEDQGVRRSAGFAIQRILRESGN